MGSGQCAFAGSGTNYGVVIILERRSEFAGMTSFGHVPRIGLPKMRNAEFYRNGLHVD